MKARNLLALWLAALCAACGSSGGVSTDSGTAATPKDGWVGAWAAAPYGPYPLGPLSGVLPIPIPAEIPLPPIPSYLPGNQAVDQSFRMIVRPTLGGETLRLRLSNLVGDRPLHIGPVQVARRLLGPAILPGSSRAVLFGGQPEVTIAPGAEAISDAVDLAYTAGSDLAVSFHVIGESGPITWHAVSFALSYVGLPNASDTTGDLSGLTFPQPTMGWFFLSGIDVLAPDSPGAIVAIGDSITDGAYSVPETNTRWPDFFAQRLQRAGIEMGVLNQGINSNTVTREAVDTVSAYQGQPAVDRFDRDVLDRAGVRSVLIFEGTNDLGAGRAAEEIHAGIRDLSDRAHAAGLCVVVGLIPPRLDVIPPLFSWDLATMEPQRQRLNELIRADTSFDALADFEAALALPGMPSLPNVALYFPDLLHPNSLGFAAMAQAVPLEALVPPPAGHCTR
ncbi:MAG TPA: GDSL-type esterase/lipase family protein [Solimonas sp.]|nr:GDSL-type esterase/lipase family protein [Solimonas sp.]